MTGRNLARLARSVHSSMPARAARRLGPPPAALSVLATSQGSMAKSFYTGSTGSRYPPRSLSTSAVLQDVKPMIDPKKAIAADLEEAQYHELADEYLETILSKFEELQDEGEDLDVEFEAGVMTLIMPFGTYVVNKQPPNKQIWLSSPKSGPKRYDWVILGDGQEHKQDTGLGEWIYLKDGTSMNALFEEETGIDLTMPIPHHGG